MKLKSLVAAVLACMVVMAEDKPATRADADKEAKKAANRQKMMEKTGGLLKVDGKGSIVYVDLQNRIDSEIIANRAALLSKFLRSETRTLKANVPFSIETALEHLQKCGATVAVFVADVKDYPMSLISIEGKWALVNMDALCKDNPSKDVLTSRVNKELIRVSAILLGAYSSGAKASPLGAVSNIADLDALEYEMPTMDTMMSILRHMPKMGITQTKMTTYKKACIEGWAPAPTNEFQKAIFEQIKTEKERGPTNPIKISPPNAKK